MSDPSVCSFLDLPDEILVKIILHFNARERLVLANTYQRFNDLVFGDKELLRNLDLTDKWGRTTESDVRKYLDDENTNKKILGINMENVQGTEHSSSLIGKAINLVELNILNGLRFKSVEELSRFLKPLVYLKQLSVNWPDSLKWMRSEDLEKCKDLNEPFSRLTYLCLNELHYSVDFLTILQNCERLEKLTLVVSSDRGISRALPQKILKLTNLKFIELRGRIKLAPLKHQMLHMVVNTVEWAELYLDDILLKVYLERNVGVGSQLQQLKEMPLPSYIQNCRVRGLIEAGWSLVPEHLLSEVIRVNHEDAPEQFCCLRVDENYIKRKNPTWLKIDEAKKLLKDPGYQISYLCFLHNIEKNCDAHLLASAFPNLTELVLYWMSNSNLMPAPEKTKVLPRRLRRKGSLVSEEQSDVWNTDSSFKMLVENTPRLEVLEIKSFGWEGELPDWDLDALNLISGWKNLTVIRLEFVPMTDVKFLIDIGKECKKLEEVKLQIPGDPQTCRYENEVLEMLQHCKNLRKLDIVRLKVERLSAMFEILATCSKLMALYTITQTEESNPEHLAKSISIMNDKCKQLKRLHVVLLNYQFGEQLINDSVIVALKDSDFKFDVGI